MKPNISILSYENKRKKKKKERKKQYHGLLLHDGPQLVHKQSDHLFSQSGQLVDVLMSQKLLKSSPTDFWYVALMLA